MLTIGFVVARGGREGAASPISSLGVMQLTKGPATELRDPAPMRQVPIWWALKSL